MEFDVISYLIGLKAGGGSSGDVTVESITLTENGNYTAPEGKAYSPVYVRIPEEEQATPTISVNTETGLVTASATQNAGFVAAGAKSATEQLSTQAAAVVIPGTSDKTAVAAGKYTIGAVTVAGDADLSAENIKNGVAIFGVTGTFTADADATSEDLLNGKTAYVAGQKVTGTIASKSSSDLTASGDTVTVPAGYYATNATKAVSAGSATTPATTVTANPSISVNAETGQITAATSATQSVTPTVSAGYVSSGTAGTVTVTGDAMEQLAVQNAQTITPGTTDQTISAGKFLTGAQTIKGDANLLASNIKLGVTLFGVTGTYEGSGEMTPIGTVIYYAGSTAPVSYLACDGTTYNIADYPNLADFFNTNYGSKNYWGGNGTTTFAVPNWQGEFFRAAGSNSRTAQGSGATTGGAGNSGVGIHQNSTVFPWVQTNGNGTSIRIRKSQTTAPTVLDEADYSYAGTTQTASATSAIASTEAASPEYITSRPTATSLLVCIKAL